MSKARRSNLGLVAAKVRNRTGAAAGMPVEFRRKLVADLYKLLGDQLPGASPTAAKKNGAGDSPDQPLPPRLRQTLDCLLLGDSEKQIARKLELSPHTVHVYVKSLYKKFQVSSRGELLARWVKR